MPEKFRLDRKIGFQNTFYTKCINVIIDGIGPSIILRSIDSFFSLDHNDIFDHKYCIDTGNLFSINIACRTFQYLT